MLNAETAIRRAKYKLEASPELLGNMYREGFVRVMPSLDLPPSLGLNKAEELWPSPIVTFAKKETFNGKRLIAEYQGREYFA